MSDDKSKPTAPGAPSTGAPPAGTAAASSGGYAQGPAAPAAAQAGQPAGPAASPAPKPAGPPPVKLPPLVPFVAQPDREKVDQGEHAADGSRPMHADREWIGYAQQGGGHVPDDWMWPHSPKQDQDESM